MKQTDLMNALNAMPEEFVTEALSAPLADDAAEPLTREPQHRLWMTVLALAAGLAVAVGLGTVIYRLNGARGPVNTLASQADTERAKPDTTETTASAAEDSKNQTETGKNQTETGKNQTETDKTQTEQTSAEQTETVTEHAAVTTLSTAAPTTEPTTAATSPTKQSTAPTAQSETETTAETTREQLPQEADPDAVIAQLKKGIAPDFVFDVQNAGRPYYELDYVPYGVAFLCRDSDLETLKSGTLGSRPVNWSEGAWTLWGGSGEDFLAGADADNCLVQPVSGFLKCYGVVDETATLPGFALPFSFRYQQQTGFSVPEDYSSRAEPGWTVCMASASAKICFTPEGAVYRDYSELIRAIADDPATVLLGIVYGEERVYGDADELEFLLHIPEGTPDPADFAEYGTLKPIQYEWYWEDHRAYDSAHGWYHLTLSKEAVARWFGDSEAAGPGQREPAEEMQRLCSALEQIPSVRLAQPIMFYLA